MEFIIFLFLWYEKYIEAYANKYYTTLRLAPMNSELKIFTL
jgi:hypothetical protein